MIHVFFVPGMFGSTIEYITRTYSNELIPVNGKVLADGSLHSFDKLAHFRSAEHIDEFFKSGNAVDVTTPIYPFKKQPLQIILKQFDQLNTAADSCMLVYADSVRAAELNMLFQYHKISVGLKFGLDHFCGDNQHNIIAWNPEYQHWSDMHPWQLREWISLFYVHWVQEWIDSVQQVDHRFLTIKNTDFLFDSNNTANRIFAHCGLTQKPNLDKFLDQWQQAQQYIVDEFNLLDQIVDYTIANKSLEWQPINIIAEAIVQQRLRTLGFEIRCDVLDIFPTDSKTLYNLLEKV